MLLKPAFLDRVHHWDESMLLRVSATVLRRSVLVTAAQWQSRTADGWGYLLVPVMLIWFDYPGASQFFALLLPALGAERLVYWLAKNSFRRRRPANIVPGYCSHIIPADEFSFPSGHTSAAFLFATAVVLVYGSLGLGLYIWAALVALSRVVLGVHFPTDTLMGALIGSTMALLAFEFGLPLWY
jgi:undecaprenyl-diphosphatase